MRYKAQTESVDVNVFLVDALNFEWYSVPKIRRRYSDSKVNQE